MRVASMFVVAMFISGNTVAANKRRKGQAEYNKARAVCLERRGYTVK